MADIRDEMMQQGVSPPPEPVTMVNDNCIGYQESEIAGVCQWCNKYYREHWPRPDNHHPREQETV
jgi:hypothetical protein